MSTAPAPPPSGTGQNASGTQGITQNGNSEPKPVNWESEIQLVSSLAKLQELENKIHELRQFVPAGLLEPLIPISSSQKATPDKPIAESPSILRNELDHAVRDRLASIEQFQSLWRGPELKPVWAHTEARLKEGSGQLLQPTGIWERDYGTLLEELTKAEKTNEDEKVREEEEAERTKVLSAEGGWTAVIEKFTQRGLPGVRVINGQNQTSLAIALAKAGLVVLVEGVKDPDSDVISEWLVSSKVSPGRAPMKMEEAVIDCLNSRPRKWDLAFLLDMIASYGDIKQTPCTKCNRLTNNAARLPTTRRLQTIQPPIESESKDRVFTFDALHTNCA
ncbi:hypothetical protein N7456_005603 [Penicillium angulare]|uniref:Uncharacterized protein n=1 Tax=Penicillium angulare TaxID=116970 RepID=A0A9W9KKP0_9EURO|nr:hypothetical protein N7456_005603 [Penicillium angulare]